MNVQGPTLLKLCPQVITRIAPDFPLDFTEAPTPIHFQWFTQGHSLGIASSPKRREYDKGEVIADYLVICVISKSLISKHVKGLQEFKDGFQMVHEFPEFACTFF